MLKNESKVPVENDPSFVLLRVAREVSDWFALDGMTTDRDAKYKQMVEYFRSVLYLSENLDLDQISDDRRRAIEYGMSWLEFSKGGADGVAALLWLEALRINAERQGGKVNSLFDLLSPMLVDMETREFELSVDKAEDGRRIWETCGDELRDTLEEAAGQKMRVMIWDNDFGLWGDEAAA